MAFVVVGCNGRGNVVTGGQEDSMKSDSDSLEEWKEGEVHADMCYFDFDKVNDLTLMFDSIRAEHYTGVNDYEGDGSLDKELMDCVHEIDRYRKGEREFFPDSLVANWISCLGHDCAQIANHAINIDLTFAEWFMMCAAYYTPDITCLVDTQTPDHAAGYINFGETYNGAPWWAYMIMKREKGFEVIRVAEGQKKLSGVYQLEDENKRKYYLFSQNSTMDFQQILYMVDGKSNVKVAETNEFPLEETEFADVYFDKNKLLWQKCTQDENTGIMHPVEHSRMLKLELNGKASSFTVVDDL